jgi:hypothetical protein
MRSSAPRGQRLHLQQNAGNDGVALYQSSGPARHFRD